MEKDLSDIRRKSKHSTEIGSDPYASVIEKTERDFNSEKGEINNIEQIYKKVFGKHNLHLLNFKEISL